MVDRSSTFSFILRIQKRFVESKKIGHLIGFKIDKLFLSLPNKPVFETDDKFFFKPIEN